MTILMLDNIELSSNKLLELSRELLKCHALSDKIKRDQILSLLPPELKGAQVEDGDPSDQVFKLVQTCYRFPEGLDKLLEATHKIEGKTKAWIEVAGLVEKLRLAVKPVGKVDVESLLRELNDLRTSHARRWEIGELLDKLGDTRPSVGVRPDGLPDIVWLPVTPGGKPRIGNKTFNVRPFQIAKYPITYAQYEAFVEAKDGFNNAEWWQEMPKEYQKQALDEQYHEAQNNPRDSVSWYQSVAFTRWLTSRYRAAGRLESNQEIRLPTEAEWQWAAQGGSKALEYPWGKWKKGYANTDEAKLGRAIAVGMYLQGAAACGAEDMSGNVLEWCWNKYSNSRENRVLRSGSFDNNSNFAACASRDYLFPSYRDYDIGFRVVVSSPIALSDR